nr:MAG TPA: hypothetical protein [Caudoviricetes sp.]
MDLLTFSFAYAIPIVDYTQTDLISCHILYHL